MKEHAQINNATKNAILLSAAKAYQNESWLLEAIDLHESTGTPTAEIIEGFFAPYCDRLVKATKFNKKYETALRFHYFKMFSETVI